MTKVALFIPTYRPGGIDVFQASLERQTVEPDLVIIADELWSKRRDIWDRILLDENNIPYNLLSPNPILPGYKRNLCASYNQAAAIAMYEECDLFISLQDYIWVPENGLERFVQIHEKFPNDLITGVTHISSDPKTDQILDPNGLYSIFWTRYGRKPKEIGWRDVRVSEIYNFDSGSVFDISPDHWEANWASTPVEKFKKGCFWDEEFDKGIAYENADFARTCVAKTGCEVLLDIRNEAISLPHKDYFTGEREEIEQYSNRWRYEAKWGI